MSLPDVSSVWMLGVAKISKYYSDKKDFQSFGIHQFFARKSKVTFLSDNFVQFFLENGDR